MVAEAGVWACYLRAAGTILWFEFSGFPQHNVVDNTAKMHLGVVVAMDDVVEGGGYITTNDLNEIELVEEKSERPKKAGIYSTLLRQENLNS